MLGYIRGYKHLYITEHLNYFQEKEIIMIRSSSNLLAGENPVVPFAQDVETEYSIGVGNNIEKISIYVNPFGFAKRDVSDEIREKQSTVIKELKRLKKLGKI